MEYSDSKAKQTDYAVFSGGCFWCTESDFEKLRGVITVVSGYTGGEEENPSYEQVSSHQTSHREAVRVEYDKDIVSYEKLVIWFLRHIDPTDGGGQFYDRGENYAPVIYTSNDFEKEISAKLLETLGNSEIFDKPLEVKIEQLGKFYTAEEYHQNYHETNYERYCNYRTGSGRDKFLKKFWGDRFWVEPLDFAIKPYRPTMEEIREKLPADKFEITQNEGTEAPFQNEYWDNHEDGIYVDAVTGEPLFDSKDKYDSGTGWPSFTKPINNDVIETKTDRKLFSTRVEVHSKTGKTHLGHVFDDGPAEAGGKRYCMNSASLKFVPREESEKLLKDLGLK